jgi:RNA polymerase sigma-70 factor, ECF subfamily
MAASNSSSISVINVPASVLLCGEAFRQEVNRDARLRYQRNRYTSVIPAPFPMPTLTRDRVAAAYDAHYDVMRYIAAQRFHVPAADIRPLIHDVFVAFIRHGAAIGDERSWLVAAVSNACRNYWRDKKPTEALPEITDTVRMADDVGARVDVLRLLSRIPLRCRAVLWLRYIDGLSPEEIAGRCASSESGGYGRQLIHRCLRAVREALAGHVRGSA